MTDSGTLASYATNTVPCRSIEQVAHRLIAVNALDRLAQERRHGHDAQIWKDLLFRERDAVADDHFVERSFAQESRRLAAEDRVRGADVNAAGFVRMHDVDGADN